MFLFYVNEIYNFLDFNVQTLFSSYIAHKYDAEDEYWNKNLSLMENVAFCHLEKTYRAWLFSSDDPSQVLEYYPDYFHYTILGDVDMEIYDENGALIANIDDGGIENYDLKSIRWPGFTGKISDTRLYMERSGNQLVVVVPADQIYTALIYSNKDQDIRVTNVQYNVEKLRGEVKYILYDHYEKGEIYTETIDPAWERLNPEDMPEDFAEVQLVEPWKDVFVYSPTVIMRLENSGTILQKTLPKMILLHVVINLILALVIILIIKAVRKFVTAAEKKAFGKELPVRADPLELPEAKKDADHG